MRNRILALLGAVATAMLLASPAKALPSFDTVYVFGDSLSDIGNVLDLSGGALPPPARYHNGRFSNGEVWADTLANALGVSTFLPSKDSALDLAGGHSANFAYGGSGTGTSNQTPDGLLTVVGLTGQVADYTARVSGVANPQALYVLWSGANDYLLSMPPPPGAIPGITFPPDPLATVSNLVMGIQDLYGIGARNFLVPNLPDLGGIPLTALLGLQSAATGLSISHNILLDTALRGLNDSLADVRIFNPDMFALFQDVASDPASFGFSAALTVPGPATNCLIPLTGPQDCSALAPDPFDANGSAFWDSQHPSTAMHQLIAQTALQASAIPEPGMLALFLMGLASLMVRRKQ